MQLNWTTEKRKVNDMLPYVHNPRKMSVSQMKTLQDSLNQFGLVEIPVINTDGRLIAGHQRCKALQMLGKGDELIDVRVPNRELTEKELKQYNVASNAIKGDWLEDVLKEHFGEIDLEQYDITFKDYDGLLNEKLKDEKPEYPIVAQFSEKYDAIVIVSTNEIDFNFLKDVLKLQRESSYKSESVGQTHVLTAKKFAELWNQHLSLSVTNEQAK